jgi:hypothetical protein
MSGDELLPKRQQEKNFWESPWHISESVELAKQGMASLIYLTERNVIINGARVNAFLVHDGLAALPGARFFERVHGPDQAFWALFH